MVQIIRFDYRNDTNGEDPDIYSPQLRADLEKLYRKNLPNGIFFDIKQGKHCTDDYLIWNNLRFASDSIINVYIHHIKYDWMKKKLENTDFYYNLIKKFNDIDYHIGCHILFPKNNNPNKPHSWTINQTRGTNHKICDRFDLTLECIKRFYNNETTENPLINKLKEYSYFFDLFKDFKGYVDFFHLQDLIDGDDYNKIKFFLPFDNFKRYAKPETTQEWKIFCERQIEFAQARNERIYNLIL